MELDFTYEQLNALGLYAAELIRERTAKGIDADGTPFKPYSTKTFFRPVGGLTAKQRSALAKLVKENKAEYIMKDGKKLWALINGYDTWKSVAFPDEYDGGVVNLRATGKMMSALTVIDVNDAKQEFTLGWVRPELARIANYNAQRGRTFLGFTEKEKEKMIDDFVKLIEVK